MVTVVGFILYRWVWDSNLWPVNQAVLQTTYVRDCADARRVGITPLYSGYAGYRESLDRDRDGILRAVPVLNPDVTFRPEALRREPSPNPHRRADSP
jgi:Excalibur calcium-binding domain